MASSFRTTLLPSAKALGLTTWTLGILSFAQLHCRFLPPEKREERFDRYVQHWAAGILLGMRAQVVVEGQVEPRRAPARLVVANHRSAADIPVLMQLFGGSVLSRADLAKWPVLGRAASAAQTIFVDRDNSASRLRAIREIRQCLSRGRTVSLFPEGATHQGDEVRPFAPGSLIALRGLEVEIVPVGLAYFDATEFSQNSFVEHAKALGREAKVPIGVVLGAPILPGDQPKRADQLAVMLRERVQGLVGRARGLLVERK